MKSGMKNMRKEKDVRCYFEVSLRPRVKKGMIRQYQWYKKGKDGDIYAQAHYAIDVKKRMIQ